MPRERRIDEEGLVLHLMNRGGARRTIFEVARDFRYFLSRMAYAVRRREIDILGYALLMTHFHLLVRSRGSLSEAMRRILNEYVRYFNRGRRRDGSLMRGRFISKPVLSRTYLRNVFHYIDENPVQARLARRPEEWPWGSASRFAAGRPGPWLCSSLRDSLGVAYDADTPIAPATIRQARADLIEARLRGAHAADDPLEELCRGVPEAVWNWMVRKARLSDGTKPGMPAAGPRHVLAALETLPDPPPVGEVKLVGVRRQPASLLLRVGLLRDLAALTFAELGRYVGRSPANAKRLHSLHRRAILEVPDYCAAATLVAETVVTPFRSGDASVWNGEDLH